MEELQQVVYPDAQAATTAAAAGGAAAALPPATHVKIRWKPNEEQLRILVRLFEQEGDSINKQRIKEIAVELGRQGDVTEANVHNWFHNRKARAKRKQKLMQLHDGAAESEVDTDADSRGKRTKVEHSTSHSVPKNSKNSVLVFADEAAPRQPLRLPSDAVRLNTRIYENSLAIANFENCLDSYGLPEYSLVSETWQSQALALHAHGMSGQGVSPSIESESKTITDDASTESEEGVVAAAAAAATGTRDLLSSVKKVGKGTMIRRPLERKGVGRRSFVSGGRKGRIREIIETLKKNPETYERDLQALFAQIVKRLGTGRAKAILSRLTSRHEDSSSPATCSLDSGSRSSTASPSTEHCINSGFVVDSSRHSYFCDMAKAQELHELTPSKGQLVGVGVRDRYRSSSVSEDDGASCPTDAAAQGEVETDTEEDFRIVWSSQQKQDAGISLFGCDANEDEERFPRMQQQQQQQQKQQRPASVKKEKPAKLRLELAAEGEKTNVVLTDGKPSGPAGTWWNSMLRHSALLFLDISIPHIALQPEEGLVRIREYMDSKFEYTGGNLDDAYVKKQVAKSLNFRRHKVMRLIEQGASRPNDVSQDQWDALIKYYADPKRREKSDKQRAALKALNMNNQLQQQQQHQHQQQHHQQHHQQELVCHQQQQQQLGDPAQELEEQD